LKESARQRIPALQNLQQLAVARREEIENFVDFPPEISHRESPVSMNPHNELQKLTNLFSEDNSLIALAEHIPSSLTPEPYKKMLVHEQHMTVTMESYYHSPVEVQVLACQLDGDVYSRKILLRKQGTDQVVQFGIVRFDLSYVTPAVREEILSQKTPLGRILINHNVLRHIDLGAIVQITPGPELAGHLHCTTDTLTYGRMATIFCNQKPAVDLLEIPAPLA